jgi:hypothetical protein
MSELRASERKKVYVAYNFINKEFKHFVIITEGFVTERLQSVSSSRNFKGDREVGTFVTRWPIRQDTETNSKK